MKLKEKFLGAILGCAVGDALGAPFEFVKGSVLKREENLLGGYRKMQRYPLGQYTDDTQMTLALAETYIANRGFKGADFARRIAELWAKGQIIGPGLSCTEAVANLQRGKKWQDSGSAVGKAGNGTAMRASPVGLWNYDNLEQLKKDSVFQSQITHKDYRAKAGAVAVAFIIAHNLNNEKIDAEKLCADVSEFIRDIDSGFASYLSRIPEWLTQDEQFAIMQISCAGWIHPPQWLDQITPFVIPTVLIAIYNFLRSPEDFSLTVKRTLEAGGDVDTTAAIAGAISGSFNGASAIPSKLLQDLYQHDIIENTALRLFQAKHT